MIEEHATSRTDQVRVSVSPSPGKEWDEYVAAHRAAPIYLQSRWVTLAQEAFGHETYFLKALASDERLVGVLPLVRQKSRLFGDFLTSVPFFNYGGAIADGGETALLLMERARALGQQLGCKYVELRDTREYSGDWCVRTDKVSMVLDLPDSFDELAAKLGSKLRSQVKRADRERLEVVRGRGELLDDFYYVFAHNMRDLGTPVYSARFFELIVERCPDECRLISIRHEGKPAAAGFLISQNGRTEIPWAACMAGAKPLGINMKLYWEALRESISQGSSRFDFGRSSVDSGTFRFKKQWGAKPLQLFWYRWDRGSSRTTDDYRSPVALTCAVEVWRRMPLTLANTLGPVVSPYLPW